MMSGIERFLKLKNSFFFNIFRFIRFIHTPLKWVSYIIYRLVILIVAKDEKEYNSYVNESTTDSRALQTTIFFILVCFYLVILFYFIGRCFIWL
jgi:hypothetical protein